MKEQYFKLFIGFALLLLIVACSTETQEELMREAPSTELTIEHIEGNYVGARFDEETFRADFDSFTLHPDNEYYAPRRNYDQYWNDDLLLSIDQSTKIVLQVSVLENSEATLPEANILLLDQQSRKSNRLLEGTTIHIATRNRISTYSDTSTMIVT
ncbi:hypothetical protein FLK61_40040 [Paenalkalicoccus suaedae]|uniref:Uncharacterized protein n=1 Tax=Paenalkalicoccus suaedae TaxID=2592382 RepID=A0A859FHH9_9BACI|nr:hypothetical protein [Paenalkalicoccus suaedae]QKS72803.1 hypothetical protein FLK61_40040 [Paenalkalicoccus suaedae]